METPTVTHHPDGHKGAFVIERDGQRLATMTYSRAGQTLAIIDHTDVAPSLRGTGAGAALVAAAVEWARAGGLRLLPLCPFAKSVFDRTPEYQDVRSG
ncbi:MAG: N-acetyltransferase [Acidobacteria bacterium]|nr:N-acetyltransferase [Acidobacteriota bacterium]